MMIMIDVLVPPLDEIFDFEVDDRMDASRLIEGVEALVSEKKNCVFSVSKRELFLYRIGEFLNDSVPLSQQGLLNGDRLILI